MTNDGFANGASTTSHSNTQVPTTSYSISLSASNSGGYESMIETFGIEYSTYLAYTYEAFTYTNIGGMYDVGLQYYNGDISGYSAAGQMAMAGLGVRGIYKAYSVYRGIDHTGAVKYVGITRRNPQDRFSEHARAYGTGKENLRYRTYNNTGTLSRTNARVYEQQQINQHGLGNLYNRINSISPSKWNLHDGL